MKEYLRRPCIVPSLPKRQFLMDTSKATNIVGGVGGLRIYPNKTFPRGGDDFCFRVLIRKVVGIVEEQTESIATEKGSEIVRYHGIEQHRETRGIAAACDAIWSLWNLICDFPAM